MGLRLLLFLCLLCTGLYTQPEPRALKAQLENLDKQLEPNTWVQKFKNFEYYQKLSLQIQRLQQQIRTQKARGEHGLDMSALEHSLQSLQHQKKLLESYKNPPFKELVEKPPILNIPTITNPFAIIGGLSFLKTLQARYKSMQTNQESLKRAVTLIQEKRAILDQLNALNPELKLNAQISQEQVKILEFQSAQNLLSASIESYAKDIQATRANVQAQIKDQLFKLGWVVLTALGSVLLAWLLKRLSHKYLAGDERAYTINKAINFVNINLIILIFLFAYLENVSYLITFLGFASAGFAIAMRDVFMSALGWLSIVLKGSVHVGDRVKITKDGNTYVGDVLDISMLNLTILEEVTLTTYTKNNGRAGRIIFVPNNYIFTGLFSNYTHLGLSAVWDSLDFLLPFGSNYQRAIDIALEVATRRSEPFSQATRTQLGKMRAKYALRTLEAEPKIALMPEKEGMRLYVSYLVNAYDTLGLHSEIALEIIKAFEQAEDIFITPKPAS
ncbi:mechanosensitive ion channel family protein [Helicobacter cynogastricus]|uniref:mechanosensitive ion channel family protein n=1 Tax=Helicobacter cynogastricus TaxID=329937 RepID=UPI000CF09628|nr:mechanosensitive ion channel domain-containing protein [Helicobacter cynogastricus]